MIFYFKCALCRIRNHLIVHSSYSIQICKLICRKIADKMIIGFILFIINLITDGF